MQYLLTQEGFDKLNRTAERPNDEGTSQIRDDITNRLTAVIVKHGVLHNGPWMLPEYRNLLDDLTRELKKDVVLPPVKV